MLFQTTIKGAYRIIYQQRMDQNKSMAADEPSALAVEAFEAPEIPDYSYTILNKGEIYIFPIDSPTNQVMIKNIETGKVYKFENPEKGNEEVSEEMVFIHKNMRSVVVEGTIYFIGQKEGNQEKGYELIGFNCVKRRWEEFPGIEAAKLTEEDQRENGEGGTLLFSHFKNIYLLFMKANQRKNSEFVWIFDIREEFWERCSNFSVPRMDNIRSCLIKKKLYILNKQSRQYTFRSEVRQILQISMELQQEAEGIPILFKEESVALPVELDRYQNLFEIMPISDSQFLLMTEIRPEKSSQDAACKTCIWIYDTISEKWGKFSSEFLQKFSSSINYNYSDDRLVIFSNPLNQSWFNITKTSLFSELVSQLRFGSPEKCEICYEIKKNKNELMEPEFKIAPKMVEQLIECMDFPFSAFGILADNCSNYSATMMNIEYNEFNGEPYLKIEDDSKIMMSNEQLEEILVNFEAMRCYNFSSVERRMRTVLIKQSIRKQFGTNMKLAALRLGSEMLYISINNVLDVRVAYFTMEADEYVCYYYVEDMKTKRLHEDYSLETRRLVQNKFGDLMLTSLHADQNAKVPAHKNSLFIFGLKSIQNDNGKVLHELTPFQDTLQDEAEGEAPPLSNCDIQYISPNPQLYQKYVNFGCRINESIDISLANYLNCLFIKNDHLKIFLQVYDGPRRQVNNFDKYANLDKYAWQKYVCPINESLGKFQFKQNFEIYVNSNIGKKIGLFHNGVLIYHRNRLITRFGECQLGQLLQSMEMKSQLSFGYFNIFGTIELPDSLEINQVKTDFLYPLMLEKFKSRINFIHEWAKLNFDFKETPSIPMHTPAVKEGPQLRSRIVELDGPHSVPVKRSKRYNPNFEAQF